MSNRKEFLTQLRARIADPKTELIGYAYMDYHGDCCVLGHAALEAGVEPNVVRAKNFASIGSRYGIVKALVAKGLNLGEMETLQSTNDQSFPETRKARVLQEIDQLLLKEEEA